MRLKIRHLFIGIIACHFSALAQAGPTSTYLREPSKGRAETEHATIEARFEAWLRKPSLLSFDRNGTIRNAAGRPVGWWGVDGPRAAVPRR